MILLVDVGNTNIVLGVQKDDNYIASWRISTDVKKTSDLTSSKSNKDFKRDFILLKDLPSVLRKHCFDINKMWRQPVPAPFCQNISNNGAQFVVNKKRKAASL